MAEAEHPVSLETVLYANKIADHIRKRAASASCVPSRMGQIYDANFKLMLINHVG
jgi:hypothetical protein